jgi:D-arginine utilization repressor
MRKRNGRLKVAANAHGRLAIYFSIADAFARLFLPHVEVVIHNLSTMTIAYIANPISKRRIGDSSLGEKFSDESLKARVIGPYRKVNPDGRNLRSITAVLRDAAGDPTAMMCVNFDVSMLERIGDQIGSLAFLPGLLEPHAPFFHDNWRQELERLVSAYETAQGMSIRSMNMNLRSELIGKIDAAGLLNVRNAPTVVAERVGMSRAGLYKHLKTIRS